MIDERQEEAAALYALDLLEGDERAAFEAELARNEALRRLVAQLRATSAQLAHVAPEAAPSPFLRERVLASMRPAAHSVRPARRWTAPVGWAAAACLGLSAGMLAWQASGLRREADLQREAARHAQAAAAASLREMDTLRASLRDERAASAQIIGALRNQASVAELKIQSLASLLENTPKARAIAVWNPLTQEGVLTVANLPSLEANKDYQLWLLEPQNNTPVDGGVFRVDPVTGEARITFKASRNVPAVDKFAVSLERRGGVPSREGPVVLLGQ